MLTKYTFTFDPGAPENGGNTVTDEDEFQFFSMDGQLIPNIPESTHFFAPLKGPQENHQGFIKREMDLFSNDIPFNFHVRV